MMKRRVGRLELSLRRMERLANWERASSRASMRAVDNAACRDLLSRMGNPQGSYCKVHIAGSKGKGSVAALVNAGLRKAGCKTGLITSPHLEDITERLVIDGRAIDPDELATAIESTFQARDAAALQSSAAAHSSWFDIFIAASLQACSSANVDWAVVECGLGGLRDSTNVLKAEMSVVSSIELEHTEVLGSTISEIAVEKASIAAQGGALAACAPYEATCEIRRVARERRVNSLTLLPVMTNKRDSNIRLSRLVLNELGRLGKLGNPGDRSSQKLGDWLLDDELADTALGQLRARQESLRSTCGVPVLVDVAHTIESSASLVQAVNSIKPPIACSNTAPVLLVHLADDKDHVSIAHILSHLHPAHVYCGRVDSSEQNISNRGRLLDVLMREFRLSGCQSVEVAAGSVSDQLASALKCARNLNTWLAVVGSHRLCGLVRPHLHKLDHKRSTSLQALRGVT